MPKKFVGENSKSLAARERKVAQKHAENEKKQQAEEDAYWADDDKHVQRKLQRKDEKDKKKQEMLERKAMGKAMLESETASIKSGKDKVATKITRAEIDASLEKQEPTSKKKLSESEIPIEENLNRLELDVQVATNVDDAIAILNKKETKVEKHPEKRLKAAYNAFEEANMARVKAENPSLRLSQLKQLIWKEWAVSPENPLNQRDT